MKTGHIVKNTGTFGLTLALRLYGQESILSYGDAYTPGKIQIPAADESDFDELLAETMSNTIFSESKP